jgi:hypothetical protein
MGRMARRATSTAKASPVASLPGKAPNTGRSRSCTEKSSTSSSATKKGGKESSTITPVRVRTSEPVPRRHAERKPSAAPINVESSTEEPTNRRVHGSRSANRSLTGAPYRVDVPRSPLARLAR